MKTGTISQIWEKLGKTGTIWEKLGNWEKVGKKLLFHQQQQQPTDGPISMQVWSSVQRSPSVSRAKKQALMSVWHSGACFFRTLPFPLRSGQDGRPPHSEVRYRRESGLVSGLVRR